MGKTLIRIIEIGADYLDKHPFQARMLIFGLLVNLIIYNIKL